MNGSFSTDKNTRLALLNFNGERTDNRAVPGITKLALENGYDTVQVFDVRAKELPDLRDYNVFIGTGGPGDPNDWGQKTGNPKDNWGKGVFEFMNAFDAHNAKFADAPEKTKDSFYICHSFQMLCKHNNLAELTQREGGTLLGVHKQILTPFAKAAPLDYFSDAPNILNTFESRDWQAKPVYCKDGRGTFIPLTMDENNALTGVCSWDGHTVGVQFHPEASIEEMTKILNDTSEERNVKAQQSIISLHGADELERMRNNIGSMTIPNNMLKTFLIDARHKRSLQMTA